VAKAVDVVIYQGYFEDDNARRVSEILELSRPGVLAGPAGTVEYRVRRLVAWDTDRGGWCYPQGPSAPLQRAIQRMRLVWPEESLALPPE
jgi:hypothetical protein